MEIPELRQAVETIFYTLMHERGTPLLAIDADHSLYDGGYGLDSMDTATLSAMLSEKFDDDPFLHGIFPKSIGEILAYYTS